MKILATADTHISATKRLGGASPIVDGMPLALARAAQTLGWIADVAMDDDVDLIIHAGDLYDSPRPSPQAEAVAIEALINLTEQAPVIVLVGNHDRPTGGGVHALEPLKHLAPGRLVICDTPDPVSIVEGYIVSGIVPGSDAVVFPLPYPEKAAAQANTSSSEAAAQAISIGLESILAEHARQATNLGCVTVLAAHLTLRGASFSEFQVAPLSDIQIPAEGYWPAFDVPIAGHLHHQQDAPGTGGLPGYVGTPDRLDFGAANISPTVTVFDTDAPTSGRGCGAEFVRHDNPSPMRFLTLDLDDRDDLKGLLLRDDVATSCYLDADDGVKFAGVDASQPAPDLQIVWRVRGDLAPDEHAIISTVCRSWRSSGWIVSNQTTIASEERARVSMEGTNITDLGALVDRVFEARPDLAEKREEIMDGLKEVLP